MFFNSCAKDTGVPLYNLFNNNNYNNNSNKIIRNTNNNTDPGYELNYLARHHGK